MTPKPSHSNQGFTLLEMLLVVAIIAVLAGIVVVAINPGKQLATVRNTERSFNLNEIHKAMQQYFIDHYIYPAATPTTLTEICNTGNLPYPSGIDCGTLIDLSPLVPTYLTSIPVDPQGSTLSFINNFIPKVYATTNGTGYKVMKDSDNKVVLTAPQAEIGEVIAIWTNTISSECPATGGTKTTSGNYCIHKFTTVGNDTFIVPSGSLTADVLVVAGGGGGGMITDAVYTAGGGGAGGLISTTSISVSGNNTVVTGGGGVTASSVSVRGDNGQNSVFANLTATGGGGGGSPWVGLSRPGANGGSGGGGSHQGVGGSGVSGQGFRGGNAFYVSGGGATSTGGGGGGSSSLGSNGISGVGGNGGAGTNLTISGLEVGYAGGGGGSANTGYTAGTASHGGGNGGVGVAGSSATANTGGGGGNGGNGGSGIVIVRYLKQI